jgi:hypothetical protein
MLIEFFASLRMINKMTDFINLGIFFKFTPNRAKGVFKNPPC